MTNIYDSEKFKNAILRSMNKLKDKLTSPAEAQLVQETTQEIITDLEENTQFIQLDNLTKQRSLQTLAFYNVIRDQRKTYHLYLAITDLITHPEIKTLLQKHWGTKYEDNIYTLYKYGKILNPIYTYLEKMDDKKFKENDHKDPTLKKTLEHLQKLPLIEPSLYELFHYILQHTNLNKHTIPQSAYQTVEKQYKKITYKPEENKRTEQQTDTKT